MARNKLSNLVALGLLLFATSMFPGCQETIGKVQTPAQVSLTPYLVMNGYWVNVTNLSDSTISNVSVTYVWQGNSKTQTIGTIGPKETKTIDPADADIRIERNEKIRLSASGYIPKTIETNLLIDK